MKPTPISLLAGFVLAAAFATPTFAQNPDPEAKPASAAPTWADLDTDKDGNLSKGEASKNESLAAIFDKADANTDGILTGDEYRAYMDAQKAANALNDRK